jgi:CDP-diacylglycerol--serine O-phosphatidyltransferase
VTKPRLIKSQSDETPERKGLKKGLYLVPSLFTAANILMGFFALMGSLRGFQLVGIGTADALLTAAGHFDRAAIAIGWAVLFDALDGRIARMTKTTTEIGVQLDSIADVVTFGIAPSVLAYCWSYGSAFSDGSNAQSRLVFRLCILCGGFRLARFNVQATSRGFWRKGTVKVDKKFVDSICSGSDNCGYHPFCAPLFAQYHRKAQNCIAS